jgi:transposase InsO family protein
MCHLIPTTTRSSAVETAQLFFQHIVRLHGIPRLLISDRDVRFTSRFWRELFRLLGTSINFSTSNHPETDGQTERMNRTVEQALRAYTSQHKSA